MRNVLTVAALIGLLGTATAVYASDHSWSRDRSHQTRMDDDDRYERKDRSRGEYRESRERHDEARERDHDRHERHADEDREHR
jgi:hypothetical protein